MDRITQLIQSAKNKADSQPDSSEHRILAELVIDECAAICSDADMYRRPASEYAALVTKFERLNESDYVAAVVPNVGSMRLMLGTLGRPQLLVTVASNYNPLHFKFNVINGAWNGEFHKGHVTIFGCPDGDYTDLGITEILTDNQDRLRCNAWSDEYDEVFSNFANEKYVAPAIKKQVTFEDMDDDIPF